MTAPEYATDMASKIYTRCPSQFTDDGLLKATLKSAYTAGYLFGLSTAKELVRKALSES